MARSFGGGTAFLGDPQDFIVGRYLADGSALDGSFGTGGVATAQISADNDELLDLLLDSQDRIVAVGYTYRLGFRQTAIVRFLPNGQLDPSFGYGGIRILDGIAFRDIFVTKVVLRPDGGLLLAGAASAADSDPSPEIFVMSLHADGTLDESFAGRGWQELDVAPDPDSRTLFLLRDPMVIHPSGSIVVLNAYCACMTVLRAPLWNDADGDGMPDAFEVINGLDALDAADAAGDLDGDGFSNLAEFRGGSDPQDPADIPRRVPTAIFQLLLGD